MHVISHKKLRSFYELYPEVQTALEHWYDVAQCADWKNFADIKKDFNSVDNVGNQRYVFNIKGNHFRLVVVVKFTINRIFIRFVGTHKEYDKIDCLTI